MDEKLSHRIRVVRAWIFDNKKAVFPIGNTASMRQEGFEPPTLWFVAIHSIQLSYWRTYTKIAEVSSTEDKQHFLKNF